MLDVKNISSGYGKKQVLFDISLRVEAGEVILLTGENGSGKSTLLKCITNLLPLWSGSIEYEGQNISNKETSDLIYNGILYIPQKNFYFENLTVWENFQVSGNTLSRQLLKERIFEAFEITGLWKFKNRKPFDLSGGERKLLSFGMVFINRPKLLLIDEPLSGLTHLNAELVLQHLTNLKNKGTAMIIVEHNIKDILNFPNKILCIKLGKQLVPQSNNLDDIYKTLV